MHVDCVDNDNNTTLLRVQESCIIEHSRVYNIVCIAAALLFKWKAATMVQAAHQTMMVITTASIQ